jgi:xylulokinase
MWLPVPSYLLWKLTGQLAVDYTIAARTLLFDQRLLDWSAELLTLFGLPKTFLPPVSCGGTPMGSLSQAAADITGLPPSTMCILGGHDHLCATLATGAHNTGSMTDSTGSANALLLLLPDFHPNPALAECGYASYAYVLPDLYALKGGLKAAGSAIEWLARQLSPAGQSPDYARLEASALEGAGRRAGPIWLPHLIGSGTPQGDRFSRAALVGAQFEHGPGDLFRGMLESLAFWTRQNFDEMQALTGTMIQSLTLTGGVTRLVLLSQLKADVLNRPVRVAHVPEAAAAGAALLAGIGSGVFHSATEALDSLRYEWEEVEPHPERAKWYAALYENAYLPLYEALKNVNHALTQVQGSFQEPTDG